MLENIHNEPESTVSPETMAKKLEELEQERDQLLEAVDNLTKGIDDLKKSNPADFTAFKSLNGKLTATKKILEDVIAGIHTKRNESVSNVWDDSYTGGNSRGSTAR